MCKFKLCLRREGVCEEAAARNKFTELRTHNTNKDLASEELLGVVDSYRDV